MPPPTATRFDAPDYSPPDSHGQAANALSCDVDVCERAVAVAPANPDALSLLADTYDSSGVPDKAAATESPAGRSADPKP